MGLRRQTTSPRFHMGSRPVTLRSSYPVVPGRYPTQLTDGDKPGRLGTASWGGRDSIPAQAGPAPQSPPLCFGVCETQIKWLSEKLGETARMPGQWAEQEEALLLVCSLGSVVCVGSRPESSSLLPAGHAVYSWPCGCTIGLRPLPAFSQEA